MRVIVFGVGAIGGSIAARLALSGTEVVGIARGSMLDAIREQGGLKIITHEGTALADFPVVGSPAAIDWRPDDCVIVAMKSNDTEAALNALTAAGVYTQPIVCAQNGVANELLALRQFPNVFAMVVMVAAQFLVPGTVVAQSAPKLGVLDIGRVPSGDGTPVEPLAAALEAAGFLSEVTPDAMAGKYGKLLRNLGNIVAAALGQGARHGPWYDRVREEGEAVLRAAGIRTSSADKDNPRRRHIQVVEIDGVPRVGSSSMQSLIRGTGSIETDYLNGEISMLGRLHGVPTPANVAFQRVAQRMVRERLPPGSFPEAEIQRLYEAG